MVFKLKAQLKGAHVHVDVFAGDDAEHLALSGELVLRAAEWAMFCFTLCVGERKAQDYGFEVSVLFDDSGLPIRMAMDRRE